MGLKDGTITYKLTTPCKINTPEGLLEWQFAILREPTNQHAKYYLKLEDMVGKAMLDSASLANNAPEEAEEKTSGEEVKKFHEMDEDEYKEEVKKQITLIKLLLIHSDRVDRAKFLEVFTKMALASTDTAIITCDDRHRLKKSYWDVLSLRDQLDIAYLWTAFFVLPSLQDEIA